jgi:hypothetical protein
MLCPTCHVAAPGGSRCPQCGQPVPEEESFEGQGGHYLRVLLVLSAALFVAATLIASLRSGRLIAIDDLIQTQWFWFYLLLFFLPTGIGVYYWLMLRDEEIFVTDQYIERHSRWGDERLAWADVCAFHKQILPFRETRLGRITGLSRWLSDNRLLSRRPPYLYELVACNHQGEELAFRIEPGSVDDMPWLLAIIEERAGPPEEI